MKKFSIYLLIISSVIIGFSNNILAQNPLIRDQFTADPSARVFGDSVYVYPSHDNAGITGKGKNGWFCMEDYHVFSSSDLIDWKDHGVIVSQYKVHWVDSTKFSMWAPDCMEKNGKYYFYFPAGPNDAIYGRGFAIGVAISDSPYGPFLPQPEPIKNLHGIDPNVFIDKDGQAYLYWSMGKIFVAKLKENMLELASEPQVVEELPEKGLMEGPYLFERNGVYYMTYPHVENKTERLEYAMGNNPMGPFKVTGVIMDESPTGCWTNHQSVIKFRGQWYLFYHHNDLSPKLDKNRSIRIDSLFFNEDGTIQKVKPTIRGVGIINASQKIEVDRYSSISTSGTTIAFLDTTDTFKGWKTLFNKKGAWVQYNAVDFGSGHKDFKSVRIKVLSETGGTLQFRLGDATGLLLGEVKIPGQTDWHTINVPVNHVQPGVHNLVVTLKDNGPVQIDWIRFTD
jgi:hypothetical protein